MKLVHPIILLILLMALDQALLEPARSQSPETRSDSSGLVLERVDAAGLRRFLETGQYVQLPPEIADQVISQASRPEVPRAVSERPRFRRLSCQAEFDGRTLIQGRMTLTTDASAGSVAGAPLLIGATNLSQLGFSDGRNSLVTGVDDSGQLYVLQPETGADVHATWSAAGHIAGELVTFRLELPGAMTSQMELRTTAEFDVSSSNGLVLGPWPEGELSRWNIIPSAASRLTVSCRKQRSEATGTPISLAGLEAFHTMTGDGLASRWTMRLPDEFPLNSRLRVHLPADVRIRDVVINDQRPLDWTVSTESGIQELNLNLPGNSRRSAVSIQASTVQPLSGTWELPLLTPVRWERTAAGASGPVVLPVSQISLTVPSSTDLLGWDLQGIEERDVVAGPDNSRVYQLTRFAVGGLALAHTSSRNPQISEDIAAVIGSSGRLIAARCVVAVTGHQGDVLQLSWPVAAGWEVMAVRYAVSGKLLFSETRHANAETAHGTVTVHLPESLEARNQQTLEFQLQQSELTEAVSSGAALAELPLHSGLGMRRTSARLVVLPSLSAFRHTADFRSLPLRPVSLTLVRQQFPVLSGAAIPEDAAAFDVMPSGIPASTESLSGRPSEIPTESPTDSRADVPVLPFEVLPQSPDDSGLSGLRAEAPVVPGDAAATSESPAAQPEQAGRSTPEDVSGWMDVDVFHLMDCDAAGVTHDVLAVAHLRQSRAAEALPVTISPGLIPVAEVNGRRVQLVTSGDQVQIPLPRETTSCVVVLRWSATVPESLWTATTRLTVPFSPEMPFRFCSHHLLISPALRPVFADNAVNRFTSASVTASATDQLLRKFQEQARSGTQTGSDASEPPRSPGVAESFVRRQALLSEPDWQSLTVTVSGSGSPAISLRLDCVRFRNALQFSLLSMVAVGCWLGRRTVARHRRVVATAAIVIGSIRAIAAWLPLEAALNGLFQGLIIGMFLSFGEQLLPRRSVLSRSLNRSAMAGSVIALLFTFGAAVASAQVPAGEPPAAAAATAESAESAESAGPDVLMLETAGFGEHLKFVRKALYARWELAQQLASRQNPGVVVTALKIQVVAENFDAVETVLTMDLAVRAGGDSCRFSIPLQDARPVECQIDGQPALPSASTPGRLDVLIPAVSSLVPTPLRSDTENSLSRGSHPGPPPGWDRRTVVLKVRPAVIRHPGGLSFRLPAVPAPAAEFTIESVGKFVTQAIVRAHDQIQSCSPDAGPIRIEGFSSADVLSVVLRTSTGHGDRELVIEPAELEFFAICEMLSGQPLLTCVYRIRGWNRLSHEVSLPIPPGYRVVGLTSSIGEQAWTAPGQSVEIQLPELDGSDFRLELKLLALTAQEPLTHVVPLDLLGRVSGCRTPQRVLVAVRTTPDLSVRRDQVGDQSAPAVTPLPVSEIPAAMGFWLRRQDVVFELPPEAPAATFRLVPRSSHSEVQVQQSVVCHERGADWTYQADVDTAVLRLFRHRIRIAPAIEISEVQVLSGEANRLDKWHRDGDQLTLLLKEGTSGVHRLLIRGHQRISTEDELVPLLAPQLQDVQILESLLTLSGTGLTGFTLADAGGAQPDQRLSSEDVLGIGTSWRFHVVDEKLPVVLRRRRRPVVDGAAAVLRDHERAFVILKLENIPPGRDAQRLTLPPDIAFLKPPRVLLDGRVQPIERLGNEFRWSESTENTVPRDVALGWALVLPATPDARHVVALPEFPFDVKWGPVLVNEDLTPGQQKPGAERQSDVAMLPGAGLLIPAWLSEAVTAFEIPGVTAESRFRSLSAQDQALARAASVVLPAMTHTAVPELVPQSRRLVISDTIAFIPPDESAVAQTLLIVVSDTLRDPLWIPIPEGILVTQVESDGPARWDGPDRTSLVLNVTERVTRIRLRWFAEKTPLSVFYATHALQPPEPADSVVRCGLTLLTSTRIGNSVAGGRQSQSPAEFSSQVGSWIREGLSQATRSATDPGGDLTRLPAVLELSGQVEQARQEFLATVGLDASRNGYRQQFVLDRSDGPPTRDQRSRLTASPRLTVTSFRLPRTSNAVTWPAAVALLIVAFLLRSDASRRQAAALTGALSSRGRHELSRDSFTGTSR